MMHWFIILIFLLVCGHSVLGTTCLHYSGGENTFRDPDDSPCLKSLGGSSGICNTTEVCQPSEENQSFCFALWTNVTGNISVVKRGCWQQNDSCSQRKCTATLDKEHLFCCCSDDFCNRPKAAPEDDGQTLLIVVCVLVSVGVLTSASFVGFCFLRKRKRAFDDVDSTETPLTTSTVHTNLLQPEIKFPQLIEMKARGRYGCVWKAQSQDIEVAVKIFYLQDKKSWQNEQEIFSTELLNDHPHVLHFIAAASRGVGVEQELWLITDFHEHGSLADYLKTKTLNMLQALNFMKTMATGLAFLHQDSPNRSKPSIAHRDFKSKNVLIKNDLTACIADFGLAIKFTPGECPGESHGQVGTRRYMSPEILEGAINFDKDAFLRVDIYALALVLWEMLTRCTDAPGGAHPNYRLPYELELGHSPSMEEMQDYVVEQKKRPVLEDAWRQHKVFGTVCEMIEDSWDDDSEARLSAASVEGRLDGLCRKLALLPDWDVPKLDDIITNAILVSPTIDTELQNQINKQQSELHSLEVDCAVSDEDSVPEAQVAPDGPASALLGPEA